MGCERPSKSAFVARATEIGVLAIALIATFVFGAWYGRSQVVSSAAQGSDASTYDTTKGVPQPDSPRPKDPRTPEPQAVAARAKFIREGADAIAAECQQAAGGDWDKWQQITAAYRTALKGRLDSLKTIDSSRPPEALDRFEALEGMNDFPLFEIGAREQLCHLYDPEKLAAFRRERAVVAAQRWLAERGIDLIFVPVPKMTEVYIEHFLEPCPADGIMAPHIRRTLLELLQNDVEVVDSFQLLRRMRNVDTEYLYDTADTHWAPRAMRIMAKHLADRIERYRFGAQARYALPIVKSTLGPYGLSFYRADIGKVFPLQNGWAAISSEQQKRAISAQTTIGVSVAAPDQKTIVADPQSPVVLIGHSYVKYFGEQLVRELNMRVQSFWTDNGTTESFGDFLRDPNMLANCRVVVWMTTEQHMTRFQPLPPAIKSYASK
jgi:hypothetical protein